MKHLIIARHAKSFRDNIFCPDFDRGLNKRGQHDLEIISSLLSKSNKKPDCIISSPSKRTKKTAFAYASARGYKKKNIVREKNMYEASLKTLISVIEHLDESYDSVVLIGHNPGLTDLVNYCGYLLDNLPTCGVVVFDYNGHYRGNFDPSACTFVEKIFPKEVD